MGKAVLKRLALLLGTLLLVSALAFAAFSVIPGDPTGAVLGMEATDEQIAASAPGRGWTCRCGSGISAGCPPFWPAISASPTSTT